MRVLIGLTIILCFLMALPGGAVADDGLLVLENAKIRLEIDPAVFSLRFLGFPGGQNFLETHYLSERERSGDGWLDPGGLTTDLAPSEEKDAALRRGPAEVIERDEFHVVLLGRPSPAMGVRLKKEFRLDGADAHVYFLVTALSERADGPQLALRNTARLPARSTVRVPKHDGALTALQDGVKAPWAIVNSRDYWLVPVPPTSPVHDLVLGGFSPEAQVKNESGVWTRRIPVPPTDPGKVPNGATTLCVLDDTTRSYGLSLQGAKGTLCAATPVQLTEEWTFEKRK